MATVLFDTLPKWAKDAIAEVNDGDMAQIVEGKDTLQMGGGDVFFNGKRIVYNDAVATEETIPPWRLPLWALFVILRAGKRGTAQVQHGSDLLQVTNGIAFFNSLRVRMRA